MKHYAQVEEQNLITVSEFPGTTLDFIEIPLDEQTYLYDTPGIVNESQMTHFVDPKILKKIIPQSELRPIGFQLQEKQTIYFDGLGRIDYISGGQSSFITYFSRQLKIHRTKTVNADVLYDRHKTFQFEIDGMQSIHDMKTYDFTLKSGKCDIVISGLGFITISSKGGKIKVNVPPQISVTIREAII